VYLFSDAGRYFEMHVALGWGASQATISDVEHLMTTFHADPVRP